MGMYDTIYIKCACPHCGKVELRDCQTKDFDCTLANYYVGSKIDTKDDYAGCITECYSCDEFFDLDIAIDHGIVTGKHQVEGMPSVDAYI